MGNQKQSENLTQCWKLLLPPEHDAEFSSDSRKSLFL